MTTGAIRAVLDANVYISAAINPSGAPGQIIELFLREAAFELLLSGAIVDEVLRAFGYRKLQKYFTRNFQPEQWFADIALRAEFVSGDYALDGVCEDPDDDKYIAAAIEAGAGFIVAGDSDLLILNEYKNIQIVNPRAFLNLLNR